MLWYRYLETKKKGGYETDESMAHDVKEDSTITTDFFSVEPIPLLYTSAPGICNQPPSARKPHPTNIVERAIHFRGSCADWEAIMDQLNYNGHGDVPTTSLWWKNAMNSIGHVILEKNVLAEERPALQEVKQSAWCRNTCHG